MHKVTVANREQKFIRKLQPASVREQIEAAIKALGNNPRPVGCDKLTNARDTWRIRVQHYRIGYRINDMNKEVEVVNVASRNEFYPKGGTH